MQFCDVPLEELVVYHDVLLPETRAGAEKVRIKFRLLKVNIPSSQKKRLSTGQEKVLRNITTLS